jgi:hypothetical protein
MTHQDKSIVILSLIACSLVLWFVCISLQLNYIKQETMQNVLRDCKIDSGEWVYFREGEIDE